MSSVSTSRPSPQNFSPLSPEAMARLCKALGHPARMAIIEFLKTNNQCLCGRIAKQLPLAQSTVSQHLKTLKEAGVIIGTVEGPGTCYCLNRPLLACFKNSIGRFID